jgi:hypothetical protein
VNLIVRLAADRETRDWVGEHALGDVFHDELDPPKSPENLNAVADRLRPITTQSASIKIIAAERRASAAGFLKDQGKAPRRKARGFSV